MANYFLRKSLLWVSAFIACIAVLGLLTVAWSSLIYITVLISLVVCAGVTKPVGVARACYLAALPVLSTACMLAHHREFAAIMLAAWLVVLGKMQEDSGVSRVLSHFSGTLLIFLLVEMVLLRSPLTILVSTGLSHYVSETVRNAVGWGQIYGPYQYRFPYLLYCLTVSVPLFSTVRRKAMAVLAFLPFLAIALFLIPIGKYPWAAYTLPALGAFSILAASLVETNQQSAPAHGKLLYLSGLVCSILIALAIFDLGGRFGDHSAKSILFLNDSRIQEGAEDDITNFADLSQVRDFAAYASIYEEPAYDGLVRKLLPALGYRVEIKRPGDVAPEKFQEYSLVVAICLQHSLADNQRNALYTAVESGATNLLVFGDHTDIMGVQKPFNDLLSPVAVSLNYDSAYPMGSSWADRLVLTPHPINKGVLQRPHFDPRISVGASLNVPRSAWPIAVARDGFGDRGTPDAPQVAGLGDMKYNPGELLGGLVLACECRAGKGKVAAFGDTAMLQSGSLPFNAPYVFSLFDYMTRPVPLLSATLMWSLGACVLALFIALLVWRFLFFPALAVATVVAASLTASEFVAPSVLPDVDRDLIVIDNSHLEQFADHGSTDSVSGLLRLCSTFDPLTLVGDSSEAIRNGRCRLAIFPAPRKALSARQTKELIEYVREGGSVIISVGYFDSIYNRRLLQEIGAEIQSVPMGAGQNLQVVNQGIRGGPSVREMWPIKVTLDWQPLILCFGQPTAAYRKIGKGAVCLVADSSGLLNYCLGDTEPTLGSYYFYSDLIRDYLLGKDGGDAAEQTEEHKEA